MRARSYRCEACAGLFCDSDALDLLVGTVWTHLTDLDVRPVRAPTGAACPQCDAPLVPAAPPVGSPVIERCPSCGGFWLDSGEIEELRNLVTATDDATTARILAKFPFKP